MKPFQWLAVASVCIALVCVGWMLGRSAASKGKIDLHPVNNMPGAKTRKPVTDPNTYPLTIRELNEGFGDNEVNAKEWLNGKRISVVGRILTIGSFGNSWSVTLDDTAGHHLFNWVTFRFGPDSIATAKTLHSDEIVRCVGTYTGQSSGGFEFAGESVSGDSTH